MYKNSKTKVVLIIIMFILSFGIASETTFADSVTQLRAELKQTLNRIESLKKELLLLENNITPSMDGGACIELKKNTAKGSKGAEVKKMQLFLAQDKSIYPEGIISGFFGTLTELAVQRWQASHGVISYGTPSTTGYGSVGPKTRAAMKTSCNNLTTVPGSNNVTNFTFKEQTGQSPFMSTTKITTLEGNCMSYKINWGDGSPESTHSAQQNKYCSSGISTLNERHMYSLQGEYTAILYAGKGPVTNLPQVTNANINITPGDPYIRVTTPDSSKTLRLGDNTSIGWEVANFPKDSAVVFYIVGPDGSYYLTRRSHKSRSFDWTVGDGVCDGSDCNIQLKPGTGYRIRAALYTPAQGCINNCGANSIPAKILTTDESDFAFTISQLGSSGHSPLHLSSDHGVAPFTATIDVKISPISNGFGNFEIDFGDGSQSRRIHIPPGENRIVKRKISHTYLHDGNYAVELRPVDKRQYIAKEQISVDPFDFRILPKTGALAPATIKAFINIDNSCSFDKNISRTYTIDWGDHTETSVHRERVNQCSSNTSANQHLTEKTFLHNYVLDGTYTPSLSIITTDTTGKTRKTSQVYLGKSGGKFTVSPAFGIKPLIVHARFSSDESCVMGDATKITYTIDWGDGTRKTKSSKDLSSCGSTFTPQTSDKDFSHTYEEIGTYTATLTTKKDSVGTTHTQTYNIKVDEPI